MSKDYSKQLSTKEKSSKKYYQWDKYSDQPYTIQDKEYKKQVRIKAISAFLKMLLVNLILLPFIALKYLFSRAYSLPVQTKNMIGLCVNEDKLPEETPALVSELGVSALSVRIPMSDIQNLQQYYDFILKLESKDILIVILQDREHIENSDLCEQSFLKIFKKFKELTNRFQIGNAINRTKWGFNSVDEYLEFYKIAYTLNRDKRLGLSLLGSSVIDFEVYAIVRSLFNFSRFTYDGLSTLLYVDRRGAPENRQLSFDLVKKILLIKCIAALSPKVGKRLIISETNWVIEHTEPYAPALDDVWVSEEKHANYLCRYYLLAMSTGSVETIYWHQLIAPGYGLIDNRDGQIIKRKAFYYLQTLIKYFSDVTIQSVDIKGELYSINAVDKHEKEISALWVTKGEVEKEIPESFSAYNSLGESLSGESVQISEEVTYFHRNE